MSENLNNSEERKAILKHLILQLHEGEVPDAVRKQLADILRTVPYGEVVEVEQELIGEGLPEKEIIKLCDIHSQVLEGHIDLSGIKIYPPGHPVDTFTRENKELLKVVKKLNDLYLRVSGLNDEEIAAFILQLRDNFNKLSDADKHYRRKENLVFPFLEHYGITGPPKIMWAKHDEIREFLKASLEALDSKEKVTREELEILTEVVLKPASTAISEMITKEEKILFPMTLDKLTEADWFEIYHQTPEIGFCLYDPDVEWHPEGIQEKEESLTEGDFIKLFTGSFTAKEINVILNTLPVDLTFVDSDDKVRYFSHGDHRIFDRNRAILGRDVRLCHPPSSVHIVEQILNDFKSGKANKASFWIQMGDRFIYIEYYALRDKDGKYLGTLEVSQDLTELRKLSGEQRILSYAK
jgi:DUF438 domain-containing protein